MGLEALDKLAAALGELPGVGRRSAERMAYALARDPAGLGRPLAEAWREVEAGVVTCARCGSLTRREENPCRLCGDPRRDDTVVCVVEEGSDIALLEKAGGFRGRYHALLGKISPSSGKGIQHLRVDALVERVRKDQVTEVVLALGSDVESDATASFLNDVLRGLGVKVTRLARGLPAGSGLAYSDSLTLAAALRGRQPL